MAKRKKSLKQVLKSCKGKRGTAWKKCLRKHGIKTRR